MEGRGAGGGTVRVKNISKMVRSICVAWYYRFPETVQNGPFRLRCTVLAFS